MAQIASHLNAQDLLCAATVPRGGTDPETAIL